MTQDMANSSYRKYFILCGAPTWGERGKSPKVTGSGRSGNIGISAETDRMLTSAEQIASNMKDEFVSVEHIMLALIQCNNKETSQIMKNFNFSKDKFLAVLMEVRGNTRVTSENPEDTYDVLSKYGQELVELVPKTQKPNPTIQASTAK